MKAAYLVTENEEAANQFKQLLSPELLAVTEIVSTGQKYAAVSLAGTIMSERSRPVILVIDAESDNVEDAKQRELFLESLLLPAASTAPYKVLLAVPSIGAIAQETSHLKSTLVQQITDFLSASFSQAA